MSSLRFLAAFAAAFLLLGPASAATLPPGVTKAASVEGITEYRLANGLKVLLFPDPSKPTITVNITYLVGSRHENYGETGMAHLLEHLLFKGTPRNPDLDKQFNARGARSNGTTWLDRTNYYEIFPASDENLRWAIEMEADRMVNSFIAAKDLATEMTVVRNEYESGENSPFGVLLKRLQSVAYDWHAYGRSTIGNRSDIENVRIENLQAFYRRYYQPDNAVLLVAGRFEEARALELVAGAFGPIPKPAREFPALWTVEPTQDGERQFLIRRKGDVQVVAAAWKVPSGLHPDADAVAFANFVLADIPTGRLHKALVESGKASQVFGFPLLGVNPGLHVFGAVVKKGDSVEAVREELVRLVEGFGAATATREEMERARKSYANEFEKALNNHESVGIQLSEYIALGDWRLFFHSRDVLEKVTSEQVARASAAYYRRDNRTVGIFMPEDAPQRAEVPPAPPVAEVMKDFQGRAGTTGAEAFDPSQATIDARTRRLAFGGVRVALLAKKNRGETVNVSLHLRIGNEKALFGRKFAAQLAAPMLLRGTAKYTRTQIADALERLKVSGSISGPGASIQTTRPNLEEALRLVAHVLREPSFPEGEFEQLRNQTVTGIMARLSDPAARATEALARQFDHYPKGDWRHAPGLEETLAEVKALPLEEVKRFHREFYGASRADIAIVGDFDEAKAAALLEELFGSWPSATPYEHVPMQYRDVAAANLVVETPDKENAVLLARQNVDLGDEDPDYPALYVANYILGGGEGLDSRLGSRIRQKEGLSYGVGSGLTVSAFDRAGSWSAYAIAAPRNLAKVEAALREELARALKEGFTDAELATAKSGILQSRAQGRAQDGAVAGAWAFFLQTGRTFAFSKAFEDAVVRLTPAEVAAALRRHIDPAKVTIVKAGDFAGK